MGHCRDYRWPRGIGRQVIGRIVVHVKVASRPVKSDIWSKRKAGVPTIPSPECSALGDKGRPIADARGWWVADRAWPDAKVAGSMIMAAIIRVVVSASVYIAMSAVGPRLRVKRGDI